MAACLDVCCVEDKMHSILSVCVCVSVCGCVGRCVSVQNCNDQELPSFMNVVLTAEHYLYPQSPHQQLLLIRGNKLHSRSLSAASEVNSPRLAVLHATRPGGLAFFLFFPR